MNERKPKVLLSLLTSELYRTTLQLFIFVKYFFFSKKIKITRKAMYYVMDVHVKHRHNLLNLNNKFSYKYTECRKVRNVRCTTKVHNIEILFYYYKKAIFTQHDIIINIKKQSLLNKI